MWNAALVGLYFGGIVESARRAGLADSSGAVLLWIVIGLLNAWCFMERPPGVFRDGD